VEDCVGNERVARKEKDKFVSSDIYESAHPDLVVLGRLPGMTLLYHNVKQYPKAECYKGIVIVLIDAPICFGNTKSHQLMVSDENKHCR
jgi:MFS superfamily sulfate permease-like transporter